MARGGRGNRGSFGGRRRNPGGINKSQGRDDNGPRRGGQGPRKNGGNRGKGGNDRRGNKKVSGEDLDKQMATYWGDNKKEMFQEELDEQMDDYFKTKQNKSENGTAAQAEQTQPMDGAPTMENKINQVAT